MRKIKSFITTLPVVLHSKLLLAASGDTWKLTSQGSGGMSDITNQINATMKSTTDSLLPVASIVAVIWAGCSIMFSSANGWKKLINAAVGSAIAFGAVLFVGSIYSAMQK